MLFSQGIPSAQGSKFVPVHLHSVLEANYSVDPNPPRLPGVRLDLIWEAISDHEQGATDLKARQTALLTSLQTPVPFVTSQVCQGSHTIYIDQDTWLDSARPTATYGHDTILEIGRDGDHLKRILLYFPLNDRIPQDTFIYSARLEMNIVGGASIGPPPFRFYNLMEPFEESTTNWATQPETYISYYPPPFVIPDIHAWDITDIVQAWLLGRYPNNGLVLEPQSSNDFTLFYYSQEADQQTNREFMPVRRVGPRLIIECEASPLPTAIAAAPPTIIPNLTNTPPLEPTSIPMPQVTNTPPLPTAPLTLPPPSPTSLPATSTAPPSTPTSPPSTPTTLPSTPTSPPASPINPTPTPTSDSSDDDDDDPPEPAPSPPPPSANLAIGKTASPNPVTAGNSLTYNLNITNNGPSNATGVTVIDTLPADVTLGSATPSQGSCVGAVCNLGAIANGSSATVVIVVTVNAAAVSPLVNSATVAATETDPVPGNNTATASTTVIAPSADLAVTKAVDNATPTESITITYAINVTNNGPDQATGVMISDILPSGVTYVADNGGGAYNNGTGLWNVGVLNNGASAGLLITATVNAGTVNTIITNTAAINAATPSDPTPTNNSADAIIQVVPALSINDVTVTEGNAGTVFANFTVTLSAASSQVVTVNYTTADGTATTTDNDYAFTSGLLIFPIGVTTQPVAVQVNGDALLEPDETFFVNLSAASNAGLVDDQGVGTILNDDSSGSIVITCFNASRDAWIQQDNPTTNWGSHPNLETQPNAGAERRVVIGFDLSSISPLSTVLTSTLFLYEDDQGPAGQIISVHPVTTNWAEATVTWNTPWATPGGDVDPATATFTPDVKQGYKNIDMTSVTADWVSAPPSNYGLLLQASAPDGDVVFKSKESAASKYPQLCVTYQ
jgi:uncharacterized repeat protein (TIGR01451 family)